jgi:hypothetical protein
VASQLDQIGTEYTQKIDELLHLIRKTNVARASAGGNIKADFEEEKTQGLPYLNDDIHISCLDSLPLCNSQPCPITKKIGI